MPKQTMPPPPLLKAKIAVLASEPDADLDGLARKFQVSRSDIKQWKTRLTRNAGVLFGEDVRDKACEVPLSFDASKTNAPDLSGITFPARHSFGQSIGYWGRILEMLYRREFVVRMRPARASTAEWRVLSWLAELDAVSVGQLVAHTQIERTVLSRLVERMVKQRLIARVENPEDRRMVLVRITSKGRATFEAMRPVRVGIYERATRDIDQRYINLAREVIIKMVDNLGGHASLFPSEASRQARAKGREPGVQARRRSLAAR